MKGNPCHVAPGHDIYGKPAIRSMSQYPYSFSSIAVWKGDNFSKTTDAIDTDRLMQWNYEQFNASCRKVWGNEGQAFYNRSPEEIELFLRDYFKMEELNLTGIEITCHMGNGYPYWTFYFENQEKH